MSLRSVRTLSLGVVVVLFGILERPAAAIPAFARAYQVPCSTCHTAIARRNEFGDAFRKAGYRWPASPEIDKEARAPIEMKGVSAMTGLFPSQLPIAGFVNMSASLSSDDAMEDQFVIDSPRLRLLAGGALGDHLGFFAKWDGQPAPTEAYVHAARVVQGRPELNFRVGLLEATTTLFKSNEALIAPYSINTSRLTGHMMARARLGAEANGIVGERLFWAVGAVQTPVAKASTDGYYHVSYRVGGRSFLGEPAPPSSTPSSWDRASITLGTWGYAGEVTSEMGERTARIRRLGVDAKLSYGNLSLWGGLMYGRDRDLVMDAASRNVTAFGELTVPATTWLIPMYLYQYQDSGAPDPVHSHDVGVIVLPTENLRLRVKANLLTNDRWDEALDLGIMFAF